MKINALNIYVKTDERVFCIEEEFNKQFNIIYSLKSNTVGKSTLIECIFYTLGIEELLGAKNEKALKPALKQFLEYKDRNLRVLDSKIFLEIENNGKVVTIERSVVSRDGIDPRLVKLYSCKINQVPKYQPEKFYLHDGGAATSNFGFHNKLEELLDWDIPFVMKYDEKKSKLYLQTIFSAFFIEQKRGYGDFLSTIPSTYKIVSPKQRVIEFILELDIFQNRLKKLEYNNDLKELNIRKKSLIKELKRQLKNNCYQVEDFNSFYKGDSDEMILPLKDNVTLSYYISKLEQRYRELNDTKSGIVKEKVEILEEKLDESYQRLSKNKTTYRIIIEELAAAKQSSISLIKELKNVESEINNYIDMRKVCKYEDSNNQVIFQENCPVCNSKLSEKINNNIKVMTLDENLKYLKSQKALLKFTVADINEEIQIKEKYLQGINKEMKIISREIRSIEGELVKGENSLSDEEFREKIIIKDELQNLGKIKLGINQSRSEIIDLIKKIEEKENEYKKLSQELSEDDEEKLDYLQERFVENLNIFGYKSNQVNIRDKVFISQYSYFPEKEGFDLKADASASDNVRVIWAYTIALTQTAIKFGLNHSGIIVMDEPRQHNINIEDLKKLVKKLKEISKETQVLLSMTVNDTSVLENINKDELILIKDKLIK